ncbi:MAG: prepilin peptidase [Gammaproteobacteria bacterium]
MGALLYTLETTQLWLPTVFVLGLIVGSFLNVVHLRLPSALMADWRAQCQTLLHEHTSEAEGSTKSLWSPGSHCPSCGHVLRAWENIPLFSWLLLRGRCSSCKTAIPLRYPFVEVGTALLSTLTALQLGANGDALWALVALWLLIAMAGIDAEHQLLPDLLVYPLLWLGLLRAALGHAPITASDAIFAALFAYLALWSLMHLHQMLRKVQGMGHGDFKLAAALGAWLGPMQLPFLLLLAAVLGLLWVAFMRVRGQSLQRVAFGPFLALSGWSLLVWPESLLQMLTLGSLQ